MDWLEKLRQTRDAATTTPELAIVFAARDGLGVFDLDRIKQSFPFVDEEYLRFLRETGGLQIDMYQLFGSDVSGLTSLVEGWRRWRPVVRDEGIPIGEDPSGDCIVLCRDGMIRLVIAQMDNVVAGRVLARTFSEFLVDVLMGPLFPTLFPLGWTSEHENEWTGFLRKQGWLGG